MPHTPHCRPPLHLGTMASSNQHPKGWGCLGILFIGVSQVPVQSSWLRGQGYGGGAAIPEATGEQVSSGTKVLGKDSCV